MAEIAQYEIRPPASEEIEALDDLLDNRDLVSPGTFRLGVYGHPGNHLLGGLAVRSGAGEKPGVAHFYLHVLDCARRQGVGANLIRHLCKVALENNCQRLLLARFVPDQSPAHLFASRHGFTPARTFLRWHFTVSQCDRACKAAHELHHYRHPDESPFAFRCLREVAPLPVAEFYTQVYGGFTDRIVEQIKDGTIDSELSTIALREGQVVGVGLLDFLPAEKNPRPENAVEVRMLAIDPLYRDSPFPLCLVREMTDRVLARGDIPHVVFDADPQYDKFSASFARRCHADSGNPRHHLAVDAATMKTRLAS